MALSVAMIRTPRGPLLPWLIIADDHPSHRDALRCTSSWITSTVVESTRCCGSAVWCCVTQRVATSYQPATQLHSGQLGNLGNLLRWSNRQEESGIMGQQNVGGHHWDYFLALQAFLCFQGCWKPCLGDMRQVNIFENTETVSDTYWHLSLGLHETESTANSIKLSIFERVGSPWQTWLMLLLTVHIATTDVAVFYPVALFVLFQIASKANVLWTKCFMQWSLEEFA